MEALHEAGFDGDGILAYLLEGERPPDDLIAHLDALIARLENIDGGMKLRSGRVLPAAAPLPRY